MLEKEPWSIIVDRCRESHDEKAEQYLLVFLMAPAPAGTQRNAQKNGDQGNPAYEIIDTGEEGSI